MYWATTNDTLLILRELMHMNARARARHRVAAASLTGEQRSAHEEAAERHEGFAKSIATRLAEVAATPPATLSPRVTADVQSGTEARLALQNGRARLLARYLEALAEPMDSVTHDLLAEQYEALQAETQPLPQRSPAMMA